MPPPRVTIIMPIRNEAAFIARSLDAVLAQDYGMDYLEVIVADGLSTDNTRAIVESRQTQHPNLRLVDNPGRIVSTGLNAALCLARGQIVVRVDGHCEIAPDYVRRCVTHLLAGEADAVGGPVETIGNDPTSATIAVAMASQFGVGGSAFRTISDRTLLVDTVAFPSYTREALAQAGPFDEELVRNQDDEYNYRLRGMGARILLAADVRSRYYGRASLSALWRQYFQYGYWKVRVMQKHPRQMRLRQFVPPAFAGALLGSALLATVSSTGAFLLACVAGSYLVTNVLASAWTSAKTGWRHFPRLPVVFAILHLGYGLGFLAGLVKFWNRWGDTHTRAATAAPANVQGQ